MDHVQPYGVEITEDEIEELRESGEVKYLYPTPDGEDDVQVVLLYDDDGDGGDGSGHKIDTPLQ